MLNRAETMAEEVYETDQTEQAVLAERSRNAKIFREAAEIINCEQVTRGYIKFNEVNARVENAVKEFYRLAEIAAAAAAR